MILYSDEGKGEFPSKQIQPVIERAAQKVTQFITRICFFYVAEAVRVCFVLGCLLMLGHISKLSALLLSYIYNKSHCIDFHVEVLSSS